MFGFHWAELLVVLIVAMVIFGPKRLPELGNALGRGLRDFRSGLHEAKEEIGINEIQDSVRDVRDSVRTMPRELEMSTRPVTTHDAAVADTVSPRRAQASTDAESGT
jgi:sec-independent protein translocase protein TatA